MPAANTGFSYAQRSESRSFSSFLTTLGWVTDSTDVWTKCTVAKLGYVATAASEVYVISLVFITLVLALFACKSTPQQLQALNAVCKYVRGS